MNTSEQAKSGFMTFITTLGISLVVFGVAYHFLTNLSTGIPDAETFESRNNTTLADSSTPEPSVFGVITNTPSSAQPAVLSEHDTAETTGTTESTVPATGSDTLAGTLIGMATLSIATYMLLVGPRKIALKSFERDITK